MNKRTEAFELPILNIGNNDANLNLPDPQLLTYYKDVNDRIIWIDYGIDDSVLEVSKLIMRYNREDKDIPVEERKPIKLLVYSYGGDGNACFSLLDVIAISKTPVYTYNMGVSMSAGLLILLAGHRRFCTKNSTALIHAGSGGTGDMTYDQSKAQMKDWDHFVNTMFDYVTTRTGIDKKILNKHKKEEWYIYADEQVKLNICEAIIENIDDLN